ncbi:MAG: CBS domain-containing protein [Thermoanaerobaculia bacterium]|nr:CBS domain-containing protein [Thermoanaerobaculia bacterium]
MKTVAQILADKGSQVWSLDAGATVYEALELMAEKNVGAVLVIEDEKPIGILSERDYARKVVLRERVSRDTVVTEIMTPDPVCVAPDQDIEACMAIMTAKRFRHLPVVEEGRLIGIISIGDVVKSIISEREYLIQQLESYITGQ